MSHHSPTSEVRVIYPKKRGKSVITQVKTLHDAHNQTREMDLMEGGMVGAGSCIVSARAHKTTAATMMRMV